MDSSFFTEYMPHGYCYAWQPTILWMSVLSDLGIALSYFSIPIAMLVVARKRSDLQLKGIIVLFALFILLCGFTHVVSIYTIWFGTYGLHALAKLATAVVSIATAVLVFKKMDQALTIPSIAELKAAIDESTSKKIKISRLENEKKSEAIFKYTTQLVPTGLLVVDQSQRIKLSNQAAEEMFGYTHDEISGMELSALIEKPDRNRHEILVNNFMANTHELKSMASGRIVNGISKTGETIAVELKIAVHEINDERIAFANITNANKARAEKHKLYQHQERIVRALEATNEGVWEWNVQSNEVWYSPKLMSLIGHSSEKIGQFEDWDNHIHQDDKQMVFDRIQEHFANKKPFDVIYRGITDNDQFEWMHTRGDTIFDKEGKPLLMVGTLSNINEIQILREDLSEKTRFLDQVLEKSLTGVYIFNLKTKRNTYINAEYTDLCGWTNADLDEIQDQQGDLMSLFHPDDHVVISEHFQKIVSDENTRGIGVEYRFKHKDGSWIWCYSRDSLLNRDANGNAEEILGTFVDITDIKRDEEKMRQLALNFSSTFDQAAVGMAMVGLDGTFLKVNDKLCQIFCYPEEELLSLSVSDVTHPDDLDDSLRSLKSILAGEKKQIIIKKRYLKKDGEIIWGQVTAALVTHENGQRSHLVSVIEDVTARVKVENALAASNASLERFAYSASHDLQEPLRKISAFSGMLMERLKGKLTDRDAIYQLDRISDSSRRMGEMIQSLLELSRYSRIDLVKESIKLSELMAQVREDLAPKISHSKTMIELKNDAVIFVEKNSFQQVLRNLIVNSILYSKKDITCHIIISVESVKNKTEVHVSDNGVGFSADYADQIFEPFRRLVPMDRSGTGMGLAICKQIMKSHNGDIYAKSTTDGAEFTIILPAEVNL